MATSIQWFVVDHLVGLDSGTPTNYLFSEGIRGSSASGDTPANTPYRHILRPGNPVAWKAIRQESGWPDIGGVILHVDYHLIADNQRNASTRTAVLDDLQGVVFKDQAFVRYAVRLEWDDTLKRWYPQSLTSSQVLWKGTIITASFSGVTDSEFSVTVREQTRQGLKVKSSPYKYQGLGGGVEVETGGSPSSGARIVRNDVASIRGTGSQAFSVGFLSDAVPPTSGSEVTIVDSPVWRLRFLPGTISVAWKAQLRNAAGTWVTIGADISAGAKNFYGVLVNYNSTGSPSAECWVNGTSIGSTAITGGLFAASAAATTFYNNSGTLAVRYFFFRHWSRLLMDAEAPDRSQYAIDADNEANLDCALEFNERTGVNVADLSRVKGAVLTDFADANGAWKASGSGEASMAKTYPLVFVGFPFLPKLQLVDNGFSVWTPGYSDSSSELSGGSAIHFRAAVVNGARLAPTISTTSSSVNFNAATEQIDITDSEFSTDPAIGQSLTFSAGSNPGPHVVSQILRDPRIPRSESAVQSIVASGTVGTDETATVGNWSSAAGDWNEYVVELINIPALQIAAGSAGEHMSSLFLPAGTGGGTLAQKYLENLGPEVGTVTTTNLATVTNNQVGWQGDGAVEALQHADLLSRVTPSAEYSPSVVYRNSSGSYLITGSDLSPSSVTYTWGDARIKSATEAAFPGEYDGVRVLFAPAFNPVPPGNLTATLAVDQLAREVSIPWREVTATGGGSNELILETYFLVRAHAQSFADAVFSMLSGKLYSVQLFGPILPAEAAMAPFTAVTVDWSADSYLDGGANGIVVGLEVNQDKSATALVFFGS